jgi:hypothetical protein
MNSDQDKIEILKRRLNSISDAPAQAPRPKLHHHAGIVGDHWKDDDEGREGIFIQENDKNDKADKANKGDKTEKTDDGQASGQEPSLYGHINGQNVKEENAKLSQDFNPNMDPNHDPRVIRPGAGILSGRDIVNLNKEKAAEANRANKGKNSVLKRVLIVSIFALIAAGLFFWYIYATGSNYISGANIDVSVIGPVSSPSGELLTLDIDIHNKNTSDLESVDLVALYPEGTREKDGIKTVLNQTIPIGTVNQGATIRRRVDVVLFGEENVKKEIKFVIRYRVPGSIILFNKEKVYPIFLGTAPISIDVSTLKEVSPNQSTTFKAVIKSNSPNVIKSLVFNAAYPSGFTFEKSNPAASFGNNVWSIGDLKPGDTRTIDITGKVVGDASVERYFTFTAGTEDPLDKSRIAAKLVETKERIEIKKPFLSADVSLNRSGDAIYVGSAGQPIQGEIVWQNNLDVPLNDVVIEAKLGGASLDKASVQAERGFYNSVDNVIAWDSTNATEMSELAPGTSGLLQFSFASLPPTLQNNAALRRQSLTLDISIRAKRLSEDQVPGEIKSSTSRTIRIASDLSMVSKIVHNVGPFQNSGPIPPVAETKTTYTVLNSVGNSFNNVKNVTYTATLPSYVTWLGKVYPDSAAPNVKYNADKREITWSLGDIAPGTGFNSSPRDFAFQLELLPSVSQVGNAPILINAQRIAGTDAFTDTVVEESVPSLDTRMESDPNFQFGFEKVIR